VAFRKRDKGKEEKAFKKRNLRKIFRSRRIRGGPSERSASGVT